MASPPPQNGIKRVGLAIGVLTEITPAAPDFPIFGQHKQGGGGG